MKCYILFFLCINYFALADYSLVSSLSESKTKQGPLWSILICTLDEREESFKHIYNKLLFQIKELGLKKMVEIIYCKDNREYSIGFKRNKLLQKSKGKYINFLDDDDDVHDNYIAMIYQKLKKDPDCVSLKGIITFDGQNPRLFIHSIKYNDYFERDNIYYRPPNHLNVIRKSIGIQFNFPEINQGEDLDWAMQIARSGLLKKEIEISEPYYFYQFYDKNN